MPTRAKSLADGAVRPWDRDTADHLPRDAAVGRRSTTRSRSTCRSASSASTRWTSSCTAASKGDDDRRSRYVNHEGHDRYFQTNYEGVIPNLQRRYRETTSDYIRSELERYMTSRPCPTCGGKRLRPEALAVTITDQNIDQVSHFSITDALQWIEQLAGLARSSDQRRDAGRRRRRRPGRRRGGQRRRRSCTRSGVLSTLQPARGAAAHRLLRDRAAGSPLSAARVHDRPADPEGAARPRCAS